MAIYNLDNYLDKDGLGFPLNFRRGNPNPLDNSSVWASLEAAQNYAQNDPVAYVGQILTVVEDVIVDDVTVKTATAYVIDNEAGDLKEVGSSPVGDENTITVSEDGTVSLYGIEGLALTREEEDGSVTKINYQPLLVEGKLTWVEPSATTVEGLAVEIEGIKGRLDDIDDIIGKAAEGDNEATGLVKDITDNAAAIDAINDKIGDVDTDTTVVDMISAAEESAVDRILGYLAEEKVNENFDTLKEVAAWIESDTTDSAVLIGRVDALEGDSHTHDNADVLKDITADKVSAWDGAEQAAKDYADDIKKELNQSIGSKVEAETDKSLVANTLIAKLEGIDTGAQVNVIDTVDTAQFGLEGKHLTLLEIAQDKVTGLPEALAGKLDKPTDGSRLITTAEATKLEKLVLGENGEVSVSGKVAAGNVDGLDGWITARAGTLKGLSENNFTGALLDKLNAIDTEVLANKIEAVQAGESLLDIVNKTVVIPVAGENLGLVKSYVGDEANKVTVAEDGTMSVNKIDISTLYVPAGTEVVLNGGSSANA